MKNRDKPMISWSVRCHTSISVLLTTLFFAAQALMGEISMAGSMLPVLGLSILSSCDGTVDWALAEIWTD